MNGPRERLIAMGPGGLADVELVAVLLGTGMAGESALRMAARLLDEAGGLWELRQRSARELIDLPGLGPAKAMRLAAAFEAGLRALAASHEADAPLSNSEAVFARYGARLMASRIERFLVVSVDAKNRPQAVREVARGGRMTCQVDPSEVFRVLVANSASGAVFLHNHPSGDPAPSAEDVALTERLVAAGQLLQIRILDHLVVGRGRYRSLRDDGHWPSPRVKSGASACLGH